jgi:hypothetical protein
MKKLGLFSVEGATSFFVSVLVGACHTLLEDG